MAPSLQPAETKDHLHVYVRLKPLPEQQNSTAKLVNDESLVLDPLGSRDSPNSSVCIKNQPYTFDRVFDGCSDNYDVYKRATAPMVGAVLKGINCSLVAYGATGAGKTHTMFGDTSDPGVIRRTSEELIYKFTTASESDPMPSELKVCFFEIYNEKVRDLLTSEKASPDRINNKRLKTTHAQSCARTRPLIQATLTSPDTYVAPVDSDPFLVPNVSYYAVQNVKRLIELLEIGAANRSKHLTDPGSKSSRSHAIFQLALIRRTRRLANSNAKAEYEMQTSKMTFIDLAGARSVSSADHACDERGWRQRCEDTSIRQSLTALNWCIDALASQCRGHVPMPYKESKLTETLEDSLNATTMTAMIATVCQRTEHLEDARNTLKYASQARSIQLAPTRNLRVFASQPESDTDDSQDQPLSMLRCQYEQLKSELHSIRDDHAKQLSILQVEISHLRRTFSSSVWRLDPSRSQEATNLREKSDNRVEPDQLFRPNSSQSSDSSDVSRLGADDVRYRSASRSSLSPLPISPMLPTVQNFFESLALNTPILDGRELNPTPTASTNQHSVSTTPKPDPQARRPASLNDSSLRPVEVIDLVSEEAESENLDDQRDSQHAAKAPAKRDYPAARGRMPDERLSSAKKDHPLSLKSHWESLTCNICGERKLYKKAKSKSALRLHMVHCRRRHNLKK